MPVLLRAAGGHPSEHRRPPSQASGDLLRPPSHGPTRRESATSAQSGRKETLQVPVAAAPPPRPPGCLPFVKSLYKRYHFNYLIPLIFIMAYMLVGAFLFLWIEASAEDARRAQQGFVYRMERELLMRRFEEILADRESVNRTRRRLQLAEALEYFEGNVGFSAVKEAQWSLSSACYFAGTLFTTIGQ